jgi:hypothetical protein
MNQSEPLPSTSTRSAVWPRRRSPTKRRHNASRPTCRPPVDRDQTAKARRRPHPHPRRGTAAGRAPDLDDSPPSGRPPPEPLAAHPRDVASARRHSAAGSSTSRWARRRPPHPLGRGGEGSVIGRHDRHTTLEMRPGKHAPEAGATGKDRGHQHRQRPTGRHAGRPRLVADARKPLPWARQRFTFCLATRRSSLSLAVGASVGPAWSIPPRRWREGQVDDCWNREVVQRREGLRLHRP